MSNSIIKRLWKTKLTIIVVIIVVIYTIIIVDNFKTTNDNAINFTITFISQINTKLKNVFSNDVIIYEQKKVAKIIATLVDEYQDFFVDKNNIVDIFENEWIFINLKSNVVIKLTKIYSLD